jgi:TrpR-related protein YerC/YecD
MMCGSMLAVGANSYIARLLGEGRAYNDVAKKTGASTATISRVNKCISYGSGGYELVLKRLSQGEKEDNK